MRNYRKYVFDEKLKAECIAISQYVRQERKRFSSQISVEPLAIENSQFQEIGDFQEYDIVLMRHAMSETNYIQSKYQQGQFVKSKQIFKQHFRYFLTKDCDEFLDTPLHPIGVQQCQKLTKRNAEIPYSTVFVSPLRRAMQTCIETFKDHPNRESIKFIVLPGIAEVLKKDSDIFLVSEFNKLVKTASATHQIEFDCDSYFQVDWQFKQLQDTHLALRNIEHGTPKLIKQLIEGVFPQPIENFDAFVMRVKKSLQDIRNFQKNTGGVIGIITHSLVAREFLHKELKDTEIGNLTLIFSKN